MNKTIIIAEAGVNHNGNIKLAKKLIDVAVEAGVDYVKFQTFKADKLVSTEAKKADYQKNNIKDRNNSQLAMLAKLELNEQDHYTLINYCKQKNIKFLSTAFDLESIDLLKKIGINLFKIPSGEITNLPYLKKIAKYANHIILSTGMATLQEIKDAIKVIAKEGFKQEKITVLHCNTEYPTPMKDVNLRAMLSIKEKLHIPIGYSDHTVGIEIPIAAVALGATVIEKHFTLNKMMEGPDHKASLEPHELKAMVAAIRNIETALAGSGIKEPSNSEKKNIIIARKSVHLARAIKKGERIKENDLIMLRPGDGIPPMNLNSVINKKAKKDLKEGYKLTLLDLY